MSAYTDADVQALASQLAELNEADPIPAAWVNDARAVLAAVAPAIAARALREAARAYSEARWQNRITSVQYLQAETFLCARADEIERP